MTKTDVHPTPTVVAAYSLSISLARDFRLTTMIVTSSSWLDGSPESKVQNHEQLIASVNEKTPPYHMLFRPLPQHIFSFWPSWGL